MDSVELNFFFFFMMQYLEDDAFQIDICTLQFFLVFPDIISLFGGHMEQERTWIKVNLWSTCLFGC